MIFIFDSTTLIYFAKIKILNKLTSLAATRLIPASVYKEVVVEGKKNRQEDALIIEKLVNQKIFKIQGAKNKEFISHLLSLPSVDYADVETLALAKELNAVAIIDDAPSRSAAEVEGIKFHGSVFLLFLLHKKSLISKNEIKVNIDKMIKLGWRCTTEFYAAILEEIRKL